MVKEFLIWRDFWSIGQTTGEALVLQFLYLRLEGGVITRKFTTNCSLLFRRMRRWKRNLDSLFKRGLLERKSRPFCGMQRAFWRANYEAIHELAGKLPDKSGYIVALIDDLTL